MAGAHPCVDIECLSKGFCGAIRVAHLEEGLAEVEQIRCGLGVLVPQNGHVDGHCLAQGPLGVLKPADPPVEYSEVVQGAGHAVARIAIRQTVDPQRVDQERLRLLVA